MELSFECNCASCVRSREERRRTRTCNSWDYAREAKHGWELFNYGYVEGDRFRAPPPGFKVRT